MKEVSDPNYVKVEWLRVRYLNMEKRVRLWWPPFSPTRSGPVRVELEFRFEGKNERGEDCFFRFRRWLRPAQAFLFEFNGPDRTDEEIRDLEWSAGVRYLGGFEVEASKEEKQKEKTK